MATINEITAAINKTIEPYLSRNPDGEFIEEIGFPKRSANWPFVRERSSEYVWQLSYEIPPDYVSTGQISVDYSEQGLRGRIAEGKKFFLMSSTMAGNVRVSSDSLDELLPHLEECMRKVSRSDKGENS